MSNRVEAEQTSIVEKINQLMKLCDEFEEKVKKMFNY